MPEFPADRLIALNRHAIEVLKLGINLDLQLGADPIESLRTINDRLMRLSGREMTTASLLEQLDLPRHYRAVAEAMIVTERPVTVLESLAIRPRSSALATMPLRTIAVEPAIILVLAFVTLIVISVVTTPTIAAQHLQQQTDPSAVTSLLIVLSQTMPIWVTAFPIALLLTWLGWRKLAPKIATRIPGAHQHGHLLERQANARRVLALVDSGVAEDLATKLLTSPSDCDPIIRQVIRADDEQSITSKRDSLIRIARLYGFLAQYTRDFTMVRIPAMVGLMIASSIVVLLSLLLFLPWVDALYSVSEFSIETFQPGGNGVSVGRPGR
ncbi:hypothetical protein U8335_06515 [Roseiconus lacunae]|uniref:hypothetical protein n=1 Tax=Roseiconus lacunae TaxID=2605694 RepID=UPI003085631E|nr:hypothetical protein U8335_06515 [Stieleria sp. HD01]